MFVWNALPGPVHSTQTFDTGRLIIMLRSVDVHESENWRLR